jgi:Histidine kinase-, DNA gyrase B-, and HSP90-like ATPase
VFEPFVRLEPSRNRNSGGSGIGLAISRNIARWHGGDVKLRNAPGKTGLIAEISLPRVKATADLVAKQRRGDAAGPVTATGARPAPAPAPAPAAAPAVAAAAAANTRASDAVLPGPIAP